MNGTERVAVYIPGKDSNEDSLRSSLECLASYIDVMVSKEAKSIDISSLNESEANEVIGYFREAYPQYELMRGPELEDKSKYFVHAKLNSLNESK